MKEEFTQQSGCDYRYKNTGEIVVISVAVGAVFVGAMYYIFKKKPSENNPGQVKLMEF